MMAKYLQKLYPHLYTVEEKGDTTFPVKGFSFDRRIQYSESRNGVYAIMCPHCYDLRLFSISHVLDFNQHYDDDFYTIADFSVGLFVRYICKCGSVVENHGEFIDPNIAPMISTLNTKGYHTRYCCEGHPSLLDDYNYTHAYIEFKNVEQMDLVIKNHPLPLESGWIVSKSDREKRDAFVIRYIGDQTDSIIDRLGPLGEWIDSLDEWHNDLFTVKEDPNESTYWEGTTDSIRKYFKSENLSEALKTFDSMISMSTDRNPITKRLRRISKEEYEEMCTNEKL